MSDALNALLAGASASGVAPGLVLDAAAYAQRVLLQNREVPWRDATAYSNHLSQTQALLKPAVALVPLDRMIVQEVEANPALREAMRARTRAGFALRALLADESIKSQAKDLVGTAVKTQREPVVLHLPSPLALLEITHRAAALDTQHAFDDDDAENAAVYVADWIRIFAENDIAGIIFDERTRPTSEESWVPIRNAAEHYRWPIGLRSRSEVRFGSLEATIPVLESVLLQEGGQLPSGSLAGLVLLEVPEEAVPESVLRRLAEIRAEVT